MAEIVRSKEREREAAPFNTYENCVAERKKFIEQQMMGKVVVRDGDREWEQSRQGFIKFHLMPHTFSDHAIRNWQVFSHLIRTHSGSHVHQGGLVIFALEGKGYSIVDGERHDWEAGDLLLLPLKPDGVEHQHFNTVPGEECKWLAFIYSPYEDTLASEITQTQQSPDY